jgi:hypothetical protein
VTTRPLYIGAAALCLSLGAAAPLFAQGKGNAFGHAKKPSATAATVSASAGSVTESGAVSTGADLTGTRNFASWLDDASIAEPGTGVMSFAAGYWRMAGFSELDVPSFDVGIGLTPRVQAGASVPVYHASATGGPVSRGIGDLYFNSKIQLRAPAAGPGGRVGVALVPLVQVLSAEPAPGESRVSWGLPVALEVQREGWRVYGSTGYFSRGSLFASAAIELPLTGRSWVTGTLTQSRSLKADAGADALGLPQNRTDISGGAAWAVADSIALFASLGRTLSRDNPTDTHLFVTGGLSVNSDARGR